MFYFEALSNYADSTFIECPYRIGLNYTGRRHHLTASFHSATLSKNRLEVCFDAKDC